jgi:hypothetical protein
MHHMSGSFHDSIICMRQFGMEAVGMLAPVDKPIPASGHQHNWQLLLLIALSQLHDI